MLLRIIQHPAASLKEKDVNNLRCNRRYGAPSCLFSSGRSDLLLIG